MRRRFRSTGRQTCGGTKCIRTHKDAKNKETKTVALETVSRLTGVHVRSVGQRLGLPPKTDGFLLLLLLLLQDEPTQVGLDLGVNTVSRHTASVGFGRRRHVFARRAHQPFPAPAPAASWPRPSGLQTRLPPPASSSSTLSLQEFRVKSTESRLTSRPGNVKLFTGLQYIEQRHHCSTDKTCKNNNKPRTTYNLFQQNICILVMRITS